VTFIVSAIRRYYLEGSVADPKARA